MGYGKGTWTHVRTANVHMSNVHIGKICTRSLRTGTRGTGIWGAGIWGAGTRVRCKLALAYRFWYIGTAILEPANGQLRIEQWHVGSGL